jgi:hypothetical protein
MNRVEVLKNLKLLGQDKARLHSLNHLNSTWEFRNQCELRVKQINKYVKNIKLELKTTYRQ